MLCLALVNFVVVVFKHNDTPENKNIFLERNCLHWVAKVEVGAKQLSIDIIKRISVYYEMSGFRGCIRRSHDFQT